MPSSRVIILEKNQHYRDYLRSTVARRGWIPFIFENETLCLSELVSLQPDLIIAGPMPPERSFRFVYRLELIFSRLPVLMISDDRLVQEFVSSNGFMSVRVIATDVKPAEIRRAVKLSLRKQRPDKDDEPTRPLIVGNNIEIRKIKRRIQELSHSREPLLVQGEPGTGKELVVRAIHSYSSRRDNPIVKIDLTALSIEGLDDLLFGNFLTDDKRSLQNLSRVCSAANTGTLFLDDIAAVSASHQARLLYFFTEGYFPASALSAGASEFADIRLVATNAVATNRSTRMEKFRKDLYYRLNVVPIVIPPLRERVDDIPLLADYFADRLCIQLGRSFCEISPAAKEVLCGYSWPGNVRELKHLVRLLVISEDESVVLRNIRGPLARGNSKPAVNGIEDLLGKFGFGKLKKRLQDSDDLSLKNVRDAFWRRNEKILIKTALERTNWNRKKAAGLLNISYKSLLNKMKTYRLA